jgi:hypothetical protein
LILLIFKKYKKIKKIKIYQKEKDEGSILRTKQHFTYKYKPKKLLKGRRKIYKVEGGSLESKKKKKEET